MTEPHDNPAVGLLESLTVALQAYDAAQDALASAVAYGYIAEMPEREMAKLIAAGEAVNLAVRSITRVTERILTIAIGLNPTLIPSLQKIARDDPTADRALLGKLLDEAARMRPAMINVLRERMGDPDVTAEERDRLEQQIARLSEQTS